MFKRLKKAWELSKMPDILEADTVTLSKSGSEKVLIIAKATEYLGEGDVVFLGEGTTEEFEKQEREDRGDDSWIERLKRL